MLFVLCLSEHSCFSPSEETTRLALATTTTAASGGSAAASGGSAAAGGGSAAASGGSAAAGGGSAAAGGGGGGGLTVRQGETFSVEVECVRDNGATNTTGVCTLGGVRVRVLGTGGF